MRKLFLMLSVAMLACSCSDSKSSDDKALITVNPKSVTAVAEGGTYDIKYEVTGGNKGDISVLAQNDWISIDTVGESTISVSISPNDSEDARTSSIAISLKGADDAHVVVIQSGKVQEAENEELFDIEVSDITTSSATVNITPVGGHNKTYLYSVVKCEDYEYYGKTGYIEACINRIDELVTLYNNYGQSVSFSDFLSRNATTNQASSLNDNTEYYAVAFDLDVNKKYSGNITLKSFKTAQAQQSSNKLKLSVSGKTLKITATNNDPYMYDVTKKSIWQEYSTPRDIAQEYISVLKSYGYLSMFIVNGTQTVSLEDEIDESGDYVAYAFGYDDGISTEIEYIEFYYSVSSGATVKACNRITVADRTRNIRIYMNGR